MLSIDELYDSVGLCDAFILIKGSCFGRERFVVGDHARSAGHEDRWPPVVEYN